MSRRRKDRARAPQGPRRPLPQPAPDGAAELVVVVGPTAAGKTALGIALARALGGEVVSADSQQVYQLLDVGTAKPSTEERARAPHHLLDLVPPDAQLSAGEFQRRADEAIAGIVGRGRLPVVVGGTGLWVRALLLGMVALPDADLGLRARLMAEAEQGGREALHRKLAEIDPETAAEVAPANVVRVVRSLEIHALTGEKPSALRARHAFARLRYRARVFGLSPPREELYRRIDARAAAMFDRGLLDEVRTLVARGYREAAAMRALGYREALAVLEGRMTREEAVAETAAGTRRYAKRQLTWFRADPLVEWLDWPVDEAAVIARIREWRATRPH